MLGILIAVAIIILSLTLISVGIILLVLSIIRKSEKNKLKGGNINNGN